MSAGEPIRCLILGGGGHARVLIDSLRASEAATPVAVLDADRSLWGSEVLGVPVRGGDELMGELMRQGARHFVVGVGGVANNEPRRRLFERAVACGLTPLTVCHPSAICSPSAEIGAGSVLYPRSVVNAGATLGLNVIVNTGAIVEHDCVIGNHAHISTGAVLCGTVTVGDMAHIGAGAVVRQNQKIGARAVVGAGATVVEDVRDGERVWGGKARVYHEADVSG